MLFFVRTALHWNLSLMAGACTLAHPWCCRQSCRTTEEALIAVPDAYRERLRLRRGSFAHGVPLRAALNGPPASWAASSSRSALRGRSGGLIFHGRLHRPVRTFIEQGGVALFDSTRTLAVHVCVLASEGLHARQRLVRNGGAVVMVVVLATFAREEDEQRKPR